MDATQEFAQLRRPGALTVSKEGETPTIDLLSAVET
jgi:hypothetical protein